MEKKAKPDLVQRSMHWAARTMGVPPVRRVLEGLNPSLGK